MLLEKALQHQISYMNIEIPARKYRLGVNLLKATDDSNRVIDLLSRSLTTAKYKKDVTERNCSAVFLEFLLLHPNSELRYFMIIRDHEA